MRHGGREKRHRGGHERKTSTARSQTCRDFELEAGGLRYTCTVGRFADGSVGELFLTNHKSNSTADTAARDAAITSRSPSSTVPTPRLFVTRSLATAMALPAAHSDARSICFGGRAVNVFVKFAEQQKPAAVKARERTTEKRRATAAEKALQERDDLFKLWRIWRRERIETLLNGPYGEAARDLITFLETMSLEDQPRLVQFIRNSVWRRADPDTRFQVLSLINIVITTLRERAGLPPIDDALPFSDETSGSFLVIRGWLR